MANVVINDTNLSNIAEAIREKNGTTNVYKPSEMAAAIQAISAGSGEGTGAAAGYKIYLNAAGSNGGPTNFIYFDVSNATTLNFKYDFRVNTNPISCTLTAYYGYEAKVSSGKYTYSKVEEDATTEKVASSISSYKSAVEVSLDVSNYDTLLLCAAFSSSSYTSSVGSGLCIYDIVIG